MKTAIVAIMTLGLVFGLGGAAQARLTGPGGIVCPTGPHPTLGRNWAAGDTYHLVFVTSTKRNARSGDIADYNAFVNAAANSAGSVVSVCGVTWYAIVSTSAVHARDNAKVFAPVYRLDLELVATGHADMWDGTITNPINITETMAATTQTYVWNGTRPDGAGGPGNGNNTDDGGGVLGTRWAGVGVINPQPFNKAHVDAWWFGGNETATWIYYFGTQGNTGSLPIYALSEPLTIIALSVPVPEPAGLGLIGVALLPVRRRRT